MGISSGYWAGFCVNLQVLCEFAGSVGKSGDCSGCPAHVWDRGDTTALGDTTDTNSQSSQSSQSSQP